jgi:hypothetical protein
MSSEDMVRDLTPQIRTGLIGAGRELLPPHGLY